MGRDFQLREGNIVPQPNQAEAAPLSSVPGIVLGQLFPYLQTQAVERSRRTGATWRLIAIGGWYLAGARSLAARKVGTRPPRQASFSRYGSPATSRCTFTSC